MKTTYLVAGGDGRFAQLAQLLTQKGIVYTLGLGINIGISLSTLSELKQQPDVLVLPTPASNDGITLFAPMMEETVTLGELLDTCHPGSLIFGGKLPASFLEQCKARHFWVSDYLAREDFAVQNAVPTAEGTIKLLLTRRQKILSGERVLLVGFGRVTKALIRPLVGFGTKVTVAARKREQQIWAKQMGAEDAIPLEQLKQAAAHTEILINTVPAVVITDEVLSMLPKEAMILDLASLPGGIDLDAARRLDRTVLAALGIPGKHFPITAAEILLQTLEQVMAEEPRGNTTGSKSEKGGNFSA
jgi:dipicolinate synthase subunit A